MKQLITVAEQGDSKLPVISITEEAEKIRKILLIRADFHTVEDEISRDGAIAVSGTIRFHLKEVERLRAEVKAPYLEMCRRIDETAKNHVKELTSENKRINQLVGDFEFRREEVRKEAAEALERASKILEHKDTTEPQNDETRALALSEALDAEEMAVDSAPPSGGAMRKDWDITVLDIKELYAKHPQCVKMTPDLLSIKDLLKKGIEVAGVRATPVHSYNARATTNRKAIDV